MCTGILIGSIAYIVVRYKSVNDLREISTSNPKRENMSSEDLEE